MREPWLTKGELASALGCSTRTIERLRLPAMEVGYQKRYRLSEVEAFLRRSTDSENVVRARAIPQRVNHRSAYMWHVRRAGKAGRRTYGERDFDLLALVALDYRRIAYLPLSEAKQTVHIRTHDDPGAPPHGGRSGKTFEQFPFARALSVALEGG